MNRPRSLMPLVGMLLGALGLLGIGLFGLQGRIEGARLRERERIRVATHALARLLRERALRPEFWKAQTATIRFHLSPSGALRLTPAPAPPSPGRPFGADAGHPLLLQWMRASTPSALARLRASLGGLGDTHVSTRPDAGSKAPLRPSPLKAWLWARTSLKLHEVGRLRERLKPFWEQSPPEGWEGPFLRLFLELGWGAPKWGLGWLSGRSTGEILALDPGVAAKLRSEAYLRARARSAHFEIPELGLLKGPLPRALPLRGGRDLLLAFPFRGHQSGRSQSSRPRSIRSQLSSQNAIEGLLLPRSAALQALRRQRPATSMGVLLPARTPARQDAVGVLPGIVLVPQFPDEEIGGTLQLLYLLAGTILILGLVLASRSLAKERRAFIQREDFLRAATHELKTPLASLRLLLESLVSGRIAEPTKRQEYLRLLQGETERLSSLVGQALDYRQVEQKSIPVSPRPLALAPFLSEMTRLYAPQLEREGRSLRLQVPDGLSASADPALLRRILWNLFENARLHGGGGVSLFARAEGEGVSLFVEDEGEGLEEGAFERVFEPFARGPGAGEGRVPGMGLGLSFVRRLTEAMGGKCHILPSEKGFCIQIQLPPFQDPQ